MKKTKYIPVLLVLLIGSLFLNIFLYQSHKNEQQLYQTNLNQRLSSELTFFASQLEEGKIPNTSLLNSASIIDTLSYYSDMKISFNLAFLIQEKIGNDQTLKNTDKVKEKIMSIQEAPNQEEILKLGILLKQ
ncbi:hypothetical protein [Paenibacillus gallinarum]|uniref:Uncharacterized protein n=1 Tax=Paenibacillus gallinarum TaxID=2762232 RepID=A0ABR8SYP6_9BACL|nr:hypothetical protein [Paenibacillus gallinarum]MBD7968443.1 hypothetical protein [Paenibacillus gallinarum]